MDSSQLAAKLSFLTDAAHLLRNSVPVASAHLMRQRAERMQQANLDQHELQQQHVCRACGHIMIPGRGSELSLKPPRHASSPRRKRRRHPKPRTKAAEAPRGPTKALTCGLCFDKCHTQLAPPSAPAVRRSSVGANTTKPPNASTSKKRARMRKSGLEALLAGQEQKSKAASLSLADFRQK
ncbi:hypothetical protein CDD81_302 [Ophiocordyceps australis]|uniref:Uncharacterized protein n=1 Tax=Ophiocordyceps australis TaxID=1399860 RepID=A0A2C5Y3P5_9HYPO|nr:hypothetical protein CDD81_302 [Ophiocordyceps australis]